jgi:hypothetical protein
MREMTDSWMCLDAEEGYALNDANYFDRSW